MTINRKLASKDLANRRAKKAKENKANNKPSKKVEFKAAKPYKLSKSIEDSLDSGKLGGTAGAGQIVAVYTDKYFAMKSDKGKPYNPIEGYFTAPEKLATLADGKPDPNARPTRKIIQDDYLSRNCKKYKSLLAEFSGYDTEYRKFNNANNTDKATYYRHKKAPIEEQLKTARALFHRTVSALAGIYNVNAKVVKLGLNNTIFVQCLPNKDGSDNEFTGVFRATELVSNGNKYLVEKGWVDKRGTPSEQTTDEGKDIKTPVVDTNNLKTLLHSIGKFVESDKFNPPVVATGKRADITTDKNDMAETAMRLIADITAADIVKSSELRETISTVAVHLMALLKVETKKEAEKWMGSLKAAA